MKDSKNKKLERIQEIDRKIQQLDTEINVLAESYALLIQGKEARRIALLDELRRSVNGEGETDDKD
jgi:hypothetical protein